MCVQRDDCLAIRGRGALVDAHHARLRGAIYIGIQQTHFPPLFGQRHGKVRRYSRFSDTTLARADRQNALNARRFGRPVLRLWVPADL